MIASILLAAAPAIAPPQTYAWRQTLDAIRQIETGGEPNKGRGAKGDGGKAIGPFQVWAIYHTDAAQRDKTLDDYTRCLRSVAYSERVVRAYMDRYARSALRRLEAGAGTLVDVERIARIHNGGPRGYQKKATLKYWAKVRSSITHTTRRSP